MQKRVTCLNARSLENLKGVHVQLVEIVYRAAEISPVAFCVTEGLRTYDRQRKLVQQGASKTLNSRHLTGHAVDLAAMIDPDGDGKFEVCWKWHLYELLANAMKAAAAEVIGRDRLRWGGDWVTFKDGAHFELAWEYYPSDKPTSA